MTQDYCYISTGQKQVLHTLWKYHNSLFGQEIFIKNLSANQDEAIAEAKRYAKENGIEYDGVYSSPRYKKAEHFEKYGVVFKHKRKKGKSYYVGNATKEFWVNWKNKKIQMKNEGFWVIKYNDPRLLGRGIEEPVWYVFYKPKED